MPAQPFDADGYHTLTRARILRLEIDGEVHYRLMVLRPDDGGPRTASVMLHAWQVEELVRLERRGEDPEP